MKILILSLAYQPFVGGAELAVKDITDRIEGIKFDMVTANIDGQQKEIEKIGNVNVYRVGQGKKSKYTFPVTAYNKAVDLHQKEKYDAIWAIMANQAGLVASKFKKKFPETKYLLTLQEGDSLKSIWLRTWFIRRSYKNIYRRADRIQSISNYLKKRAVKYGYTGPIDLIPNGVNIAHFSQKISAEERLSLRKEVGLSDKDKVIISASRLVEKNGLDTLIKSIKDMDVKVMLLGTGKQEIKLKSLAQELGVKHKILFLGHKNHRELPKFLQLADIFIRPSRTEGLGSAFLEAMAAGLPIIATPVGGIPDFLIDKQTGLFCLTNNPRDLREKIEMLLSDKSLYNSIMSKGSKMVAGRYDWDRIASEMKVVLKNL